MQEEGCKNVDNRIGETGGRDCHPVRNSTRPQKSAETRERDERGRQIAPGLVK